MPSFLNESTTKDENIFTEADQLALDECEKLIKQLDSLQENIITIRRKEDKDVKRNRAISRRSMFLAKQNNDILYTKFKGAFTKMRSLREAIRAKYKAESRATLKD